MGLLLLAKDIGKRLMFHTERLSGLREHRGHHLVGCLLKADSIVLDLGANRGGFSGEIVREWGCRVIGVEADPATYASIPQTTGARFLNLAVSSSEEPVILHLSNNPEGPSVNISVANGEMGSRGRTVEVPGVTVPSLLRKLGLDHVDLVKVDIEGAEIEAIRATPDDQLLVADQITIEFHDCFDPIYSNGTEATKKRLICCGYLCLQMSAPSNLDVLFVHGRVFKKLGVFRTCGLFLLAWLILPVKRAWGNYLHRTHQVLQPGDHSPSKSPGA
jgi:FkbM family methyltransferase